jgi:uncharacterized protein (DUF924 family)
LVRQGRDLRWPLPRLRESPSRRRARRVLASAEGALALVLLLDQIPRNIYRNSPHAFATDGLAQSATRRAIARGFDAAIEQALRVFFYLPLEHAEDLTLQEEGVRLTAALADPDYFKYAKLHRDIIARYGRFPHRNLTLDRASTPDELAFLAEGGFAG